MKKLLCIVLCSLTYPTYSQVVALENERQNIAYLCLPNRLTLAASNCRPQELALQTDNGRIEKGENAGEYYYYPKKFGKSTISVTRNVGGKKVIIATRQYRIKRLNGQASFGGLGGKAKKLDIYTIRGMRGYVNDMDIDAPFRVTSYDITVKRGNIEVFNRHISDKNGSLDNETIDFFARLKNEDKIVFSDVTAYDCAGEVRQLNSIEVIVTHAEEFQPKDGVVFGVMPDGDTVKLEVRDYK
jgi:hypothetical protein